MKRLLASLGILFLVLFTASADAQSVQSFHFSSFHADYYLSKDQEGRSSLRVVETVTAEFPPYEQNKGLVRAIPKTYDGHTVSFELKSLTRNGAHEPVYDQYSKDGHVVVETGTDDYVLGTQVYEFTYTLRDVTKDFGEYQEFFWDVNGTEWRQRFEKVSATIYVDQAIEEAFTEEVRCFAGSAGSTESCETWGADSGTAYFTAGTQLPGQTMSFVVKFDANTFAPYDEGQAGMVRTLAAAAAWAASIMASLYALKVRFTRGRDAKGRGVIIPQYVPPKDISLWTAASVAKMMTKAMPAQIVDLAVRKKIRIIEKKKKVLFFGSKEYTLELLDTSGLANEESELVSILFGSGAHAGATYEMKKNDSSRQMMLQAYLKTSNEAVVKDGYRYKLKLSWLAFIAPLLAGVIGLIILINMNTTGVPGDWRFGSIGVAIASLLIVIVSAAKRPLTDKGREVVDYLKGLEDYIKLAEVERIKFLQSPEGAEKVSINTDDKQQMVKLYEKVLPYAILFGQEKEWAKVLEVYYKETGTNAPGWYAGTGAFNASSFSSSLGSFSSSSSSSSGFSGGGGAGGGGGGGGGGGR